jgi:2-keto-4-pentenoate hydratase/2-oxohepta-3-ene-1,7-dioic acid hydratase in catechol pathway
VDIDATPFSLGTFHSPVRGVFPGMVIKDEVYAIADIADRCDDSRLPRSRLSMLDVLEAWTDVLPMLCSAAGQCETLRGAKIETLKALAPIMPRQILCAGANYRKHVIDLLVDHPGSGSDPSSPVEERRRRAEKIMDHRVEHGQPFAFVKAQSAVLGPYDDLAIPADSAELDWELELGVVIGRAARRIDRSKALDHVAGYVICNDISARDHLSRPDFPSLGLDFLAGKCGPGFLPLGPTIVPAQFVRNPQDLMLTLRLNGEIMQHESTHNMIFSVARLIEYISTHMQLLPGDLICTGSPSGNGTHHGRFMRPGDMLEGCIESLGMQRIQCRAETLTPGSILHRPFVALQPS